MTEHDDSEQLLAQVGEALAQSRPLHIQGGNSKAFFGEPTTGELLDVTAHRGIINYEPTELVLTARAGTSLTVVEQALAAENQMLPYEPPNFTGDATIGGAVACGLSGPRRPWAGSARDLVLGLGLINGRGEQLRFGGQVMKNVAGYDVSRVVTGALGTLGVITYVSLKVLPRPERVSTHVLTLERGAAMQQVEDWFRQGLPVSGAAHDGQALYLRLEGSDHAVSAADKAVDGDRLDDPDIWWVSLRDQRHPWFTATDEAPLWRISLPPLSPPLQLDGKEFHDWNGQLRWLRSRLPAAGIRERAAALGGHATLFRGDAGDAEVFHPLPAPVMKLQRRLKHAFDPHGIFNPGRLWREH